MNAIVRKHIPVESLPVELREGLPTDGWVSIKIIPESTEPAATPLAALVGRGRNVHGDEGSVLSHIRSLREDD